MTIWNTAAGLVAVIMLVVAAVAAYYKIEKRVDALEIADLIGRVDKVEKAMSQLREKTGECSWKSVGYDKSHGHDQIEWCPVGSFITQIDIDGGASGGNFPIIGRVKCCKALP